MTSRHITTHATHSDQDDDILPTRIADFHEEYTSNAGDFSNDAILNVDQSGFNYEFVSKRTGCSFVVNNSKEHPLKTCLE